MAREKKACGFEGCDRPHAAKGYCNSHADQLRRRGWVGPLNEKRGPAPGWRPSPTCDVPVRGWGDYWGACGEDAVGRRGMCPRHAEAFDSVTRVAS